jgi:hypothetical protein
MLPGDVRVDLDALESGTGAPVPLVPPEPQRAPVAQGSEGVGPFRWLGRSSVSVVSPGTISAK